MTLVLHRTNVHLIFVKMDFALVGLRNSLHNFTLLFFKKCVLEFPLNVISFLAVATDIMVATGNDGSSNLDDVEMIRITEATNDVMVEKCSKNVPTYPLKVHGAAGTTLTSGEPFVCGGKPETDKCYQFVKNEWREATQLPSLRYEMAMTTTADTTFISGGWDHLNGSLSGYGHLNEFHRHNGSEWQPLTPMPIRVFRNCLVEINATHLLNIGGRDSTGLVSK